MDMLWFVVAPIGGAISLAGILGMAGAVMARWQRLKREQRQIRQRLARVQRDLKSWQCWRCKDFFESEQRPRPLCLCNQCLAEYKAKVA